MKNPTKAKNVTVARMADAESLARFFDLATILGSVSDK
jgi:hypothetical protein